MINMQDETFFDEDTLFKVAEGLHAAGVPTDQITDSISQMLNRGILFRERVPESVSTQTKSGIIKKLVKLGVFAGRVLIFRAGL